MPNIFRELQQQDFVQPVANIAQAAAQVPQIQRNQQLQQRQDQVFQQQQQDRQRNEAIGKLKMAQKLAASSIPGDADNFKKNVNAFGSVWGEEAAAGMMKRNPKGFLTADEIESAKRNLAAELGKLEPSEMDTFGSGSFDVRKVGKEANVKSSKILEDGTIIQSTARGRRVIGPTGETLKGQAAADAIKEAMAEEVSNARKISGEKREAALEAELDLKGQVEADIINKKDAAKASTKAADKVEKINQNIANIDKVIALIDSGAKTGPIRAMLPSVKATSTQLDNLQRKLGLDVVGNVTFGALSKGELDLALSVAIPLKLPTPELRKWLVRKKEAQEKLSDYVEAAAIFLGTPGNTKGEWLKQQKKKRKIRKDRGEKAAAVGVEFDNMSDEELQKIALGG